MFGSVLRIAVMAQVALFAAPNIAAQSKSGIPRERFDRIGEHMFTLSLAHDLEVTHVRLMKQHVVILVDSSISCRYEMKVDKDGCLLASTLVNPSGLTHFDRIAGLAVQAVFPRTSMPRAMLESGRESATLSFTFRGRYKTANKAPEPTTTSVMPPACAGVTPAAVVAHL